MTRILALILIVLFSSCCEKNAALNLTFTGDVFLNRGVADELLLHGDSLLLNSIKAFSTRDYFIINYEGTFSKTRQPQDTGYKFRANHKLASLLKLAGVTHASVANNHSFDYGKEGFKTTLKILEQNNITPLGVGCHPVILKKGKDQCAILAASLTTNKKNFCLSSADRLKENVQQFKTLHPNTPLILFLHWGLELQPRPEQWQVNLAKELARLGADAIIGHHPHVLQGIEFIGHVPVFYSLGNFLADAFLPSTDESIIVNMSVKDKIKATHIVPISLKKYFPKRISQEKQINIIRHLLQYSRNIAIVRHAHAWEVKRISDVDFTEASNLWLFSANDFVVAIKKLTSGKKILTLLHDQGYSNSITLHGRLSEIRIADIDNNGSEDVILALRKKVKFDPTYKKRINIFSYRNGNLQPLWLGTKFIHDIISFDVLKTECKNYLSTLESDSANHFYKRVYEWDNFGFALKKSYNWIGDIKK